MRDRIPAVGYKQPRFPVGYFIEELFFGNGDFDDVHKNSTCVFRDKIFHIFDKIIYVLYRKNTA